MNINSSNNNTSSVNNHSIYFEKEVEIPMTFKIKTEFDVPDFSSLITAASKKVEELNTKMDACRQIISVDSELMVEKLIAYFVALLKPFFKDTDFLAKVFNNRVVNCYSTKPKDSLSDMPMGLYIYPALKGLMVEFGYQGVGRFMTLYIKEDYGEIRDLPKNTQKYEELSENWEYLKEQLSKTIQKRIEQVVKETSNNANTLESRMFVMHNFLL